MMKRIFESAPIMATQINQCRVCGNHQLEPILSLDRCGLQIIDVETNEVNGGSFAVTAAKASAPLPVNTGVIESLLLQKSKPV